MADHSYNHLSVHPNPNLNLNSNQSNQSQSQQNSIGSNGEQNSSGNSSKSLVRGNSVVTLNQIYQHHNSIPVRNRILNTAKSLYSSVEVPTFASGGSDSLPDDTILLPAGGTSAQRHALSPGDLHLATRPSYVSSQHQKSAQSDQLQPSSSSILLSNQQKMQPLQQQQSSSRNVQATPTPKQPLHSLATSPVRIINVARRHRKQSSSYLSNNQHDQYATGGNSSSNAVAHSSFQNNNRQNWRQNSQSIIGSPRRNKLTAWSSDSSSCSSSRDASPIQGTSPAQQRSPTNSARQLEVANSQQQQQGGMPAARSATPSPTTIRTGQLTAPTQSDIASNSSPSHQANQALKQQQSASPRRRILPKIGATNQSQSFAPDTSPVHQRHTYLDAQSAATLKGQTVETQSSGLVPTSASSSTSTSATTAATQQASLQTQQSTKRHRKLPQIPTQASVQQVNISGESNQFNSDSQLQCEAPAVQQASGCGGGSGGSGYGPPNIPARRVLTNKSLSSSSSASSNSPLLADTRQCLPQTRQTLALSGSSTTGGASASVRHHHQAQQQHSRSAGEQLRVLSFPMPCESNSSQTTSTNHAGPNLASPLARANTLVHPPGLSSNSSFGNQLMNQAVPSSGNKSLDSSPPGHVNRISSYKQAPIISRQRHSTSSSSSNSPAASTSNNNRSPSYSQQPQMSSSDVKISRYFTFEPQQANDQANSIANAGSGLQSAPFTNYASSCDHQSVGQVMANNQTVAELHESGNMQLEHQQLNVSGAAAAANLNSGGRGRRLSTCGSGLRANFLMNKQHAISEFTPPRSLESSTSRGSTDGGAAAAAAAVAAAGGGSQMMPCTSISQDASLAPNLAHSFTQLTTPTLYGPEDLIAVGVSNNNDWNLNLSNNNCGAVVADNFEFVGGGNRSLSSQNIRSCGTLMATNSNNSNNDNQASNFILPNSSMIANLTLVGQSQVNSESICSSNCDLAPNSHHHQQQQLAGNIISIKGSSSSINNNINNNNNNNAASQRSTNKQASSNNSAYPIVSIGNFTTVANYGQRRPSAAMVGLPPRAASATEASCLQLNNVLTTAKSSSLAPHLDSANSFQRTLSANLKLVPATRSMIMPTPSANYVISSDSAALSGGTFWSKPLMSDSVTSSAAVPATTVSSSATPTHFSRDRRLYPSFGATNALSVDVYHNCNEDSYITPSVLSSATPPTPTTTTTTLPTPTTTNLSPFGQVKQANDQQQQRLYLSQYEQRNSLALPAPRVRQHSNVSTNSMPAGALIAVPANNQASSDFSPNQIANCSPLAASLSQASSGEAQKARKFGAWAERIAASSATSATGKGAKRASAGSTSSRRARSTSQLEGSSSGQHALGRSISGNTSSSSGSISSFSRINNNSSNNNNNSRNNNSSSSGGDDYNNNHQSGRLLGAKRGTNDASSITSTQLSPQSRDSSSSSSTSSSSMLPSRSSASLDTSTNEDENEFGSKKKTILVRRQKRKRHKQKKLSNERTGPKGEQTRAAAVTMTRETIAIMGSANKSVDQLTLSDRLKLAERSANELFRKVELSPSSQLSGTKQSSLDSNSTNIGAQNTFFAGNNNHSSSIATGHQSKARSQCNSIEDQQQFYWSKKDDTNKGRNGSATQIDFSAPKGGGESHEFADDEQGDDLSLFLRSVDKQCLRKRQQEEQQRRRYHESENKFLPPSNTLYNGTNDENNNNNVSKSGNNNTFSSARLNKQTSKLLRNVQGSLRLGKLRKNNSLSNFSNTTGLTGRTISDEYKLAADDHQNDETPIKMRLRPPKSVRRALTFRSLAKTFSWRANSCESQHQQPEANQEQQALASNTNRAHSSQIEGLNYIDPESTNLHPHYSNPSSSSPISGGCGADTPITPTKDPHKTKSSAQLFLQGATNQLKSPFQRPSLSSFSRLSSSRGSRGGGGAEFGAAATTKGSRSRNSSSSTEVAEVAQSGGNLSTSGIARGGAGYYNAQPEYATPQRRATSSSSPSSMLTKHHRSLGRMKSGKYSV